MNDILLCTLNARYTHCAFGLRYLFANLKELQPRASIVEFTISQNPREIAEILLARSPTVLGFGVYIWNTKQTYEVVSILKSVRPELKIVLGGPEVSYESETQAICQLADLTLKGEADFKFYEICRDFFGKGFWPNSRFIQSALPEIRELKLPYDYYSDSDIKNRVIYVEASRGCPYKCEYCLSSLDQSVRTFDLDRFLEALGKLIDRGTRQFKFIDRTFNLSPTTSQRILSYFLERIEKLNGEGLFLHFEMVPDRLPVELRELIAKFPAGSLQFEIGIQTWNPEVARLVSRRQNYAKITENLDYLEKIGTVHTHVDLIAGLPSETIESFAHGFDEVAKLSSSEIQVGILKRLKGTPISRHDVEWQMVYQEAPPFTILRTKTMSFETIQKITRFAHYWDLVANSGNFKRTMGFLRQGESFFWEFDRLAAFLHERHGKNSGTVIGIALLNLLESVWIYLKSQPGIDGDELRAALIQDYTGSIKRDVPSFLRAGTPAQVPQVYREKSHLPTRQARHFALE